MDAQEQVWFADGVLAIAVCKVVFESTDVVELSLSPGDRVLITRENVGEGWLEGMKVGGDTIGLFPQAYVEILKRPDKAPEAAVATSQDAEPVKFSSTNPFACEDSRTNSPLADEENVMARAALIMKDMQADAAGGAPAAVADPRRASISSGEWSVGPTILPGAKWKRQSEPFEVTIFKAENRGTKFAGIKQFTVFRVTDTRTNVTVDRRFKHFTWLHEQLCRIYPHFLIPPLPGKQVSGRFEDEFVERRRRALERFLDRVAKHPVLGSSAVLLHFLTADDHKNWKAGKRLSEQIPVASETIDVKQGEHVDAVEILARTSTFMEWLSKRLAGWHDAGEGLSASFHALADAFQKMGLALMQFSGPTAGQPEYSEWWDGGRAAGEFAGVLMSLSRFGSGIERIALMIREHQEQQSITLLEFLKHYSELAKALPAFPRSRKSGGEKPPSSPRPRMPSTAGADDNDTSDDLKEQILLAELRYFHERLIQDFQSLIHEFIQEQIEFHRKAAETWESLVPDFEGLLDVPQ